MLPSSFRPRLRKREYIVQRDVRDPASAQEGSPISTTTKQLSSSIISVTRENSRWTSLPDSENHLENKLCELISTSLPDEYLMAMGGGIALAGRTTTNGKGEGAHLDDNRMANFWASARQSDVFPVPGGPCRRTKLRNTPTKVDSETSSGDQERPPARLTGST